jgi:membrane associated rhomboid family serine protease
VVESLFGRFLAGLVSPPGRAPEGVLLQFREGLALVELPGSAAAVVVLDAAGLPPDEVGRRLTGVVESQEGGMLYAVITGGGAELRPLLQAADRQSRDPAHLSVYHLDGEGRLERLGGRSAPALGRAAEAMRSAAPITVAEVPALIERGRKEREEAARFVAGMRGRFPPVTSALIAACVVLYAVAALWGGGSMAPVALQMGANSAEAVRQGQVWRLLTSAFLHGSIMHILFNMIALQSFGGFLEAVLGWRRYLVLYGLAALGGALASALVMKVHVSLGASGAIWGLMLGGFALTRSRAGVLPARIAAQLRRRLAGVLVLNVLLSFVPGIDFSAHFGGGLVGYLLVATGLLVPRGAGDPSWLRAAALATIVAMAASVGTALATGRPWSPRPADDTEVVWLAPQGALVELPEMVNVQAICSRLAVPLHMKVAPAGVSVIDPPETVPVTGKPDTLS